MFTDQNSKPLEIEDKISITLVGHMTYMTYIYDKYDIYKNHTLFSLTK